MNPQMLAQLAALSKAVSGMGTSMPGGIAGMLNPQAPAGPQQTGSDANPFPQPSPAAPAAPTQFKMPQGGLMGMMSGKSAPQGLLGLLMQGIKKPGMPQQPGSPPQPGGGMDAAPAMPSTTPFGSLQPGMPVPGVPGMNPIGF